MTRLRVGKVILLEAYFWWTRVKCADRLISSDMDQGLLMDIYPVGAPLEPGEISQPHIF